LNAAQEPLSVSRVRVGTRHNSDDMHVHECVFEALFDARHEREDYLRTLCLDPGFLCNSNVSCSIQLQCHSSPGPFAIVHGEAFLY
jgi:hypothetical protein